MKSSHRHSSVRRFVGVFAVVASSLALASCSAVSDSSSVLTVNRATYARSDFERIAQELVDAKQFTPDASGKITATDARILAGVLAQYLALSEFLEKNGESITDEDRATVLDSIQPDDPYFTWSKELQDLTINFSSIDAALSRVESKSDTELKAMYESNPVSTGQLCMRHILVKSEKEAQEALSQLNDGADFAELAKKVSIDEAANNDGGALLSQTGGACSALTDLQSSFDPDFLLGAMDAKAGVPTGPVQSSFGYHVILLRPYDEVSDSLAENAAAGGGAMLAAGFVASSKISINPKYGTWNRATAKVD